jgi:hypothetical protein
LIDAVSSNPIMAIRLVNGLADEDGIPRLLVSGRSVGPPPGVPLLWVFGDVGSPPEEETLHVSATQDDLKHRALRATNPVVDLFFGGDGLRIVANALPWRGMSHASMSSRLNLVDLVDRLSQISGGALLDLRFDGEGGATRVQGPAVPVGVKSDRWWAFARYSAGLGARFAEGALGRAPSGQLQVIVAPSAARHDANGDGQVPPTLQKALPWQVKPKRSHAPWPVFPWLLLGFGAVAELGRINDHGLGMLWVAACGLLALAGGLRALLTLQKVMAVPQAKARSMALGPVELGGVVRGCAPFPSPRSGVLCAWLRWVIEERSTDSRGNSSWSTLSHGEMTQIPFHLDDGTGTVLVQPAGAEVEVEPMVTPLGLDQRVREWAIPEDGTVFVYGMAQRRDHADERRALLQDRLREGKHDATLRTRLGLPPEGELSVDQWENVRASIQGAFDREMSESDSGPDEVFVGESPTVPLIISELSRQSELGRLRLRLWGGVLGGGVLLLLSLLAELLHVTGGLR